MYIIEAPADLEFCEVFSSTKLRDEFGDEGERISVLDSHSIQCVMKGAKEMFTVTSK